MLPLGAVSRVVAPGASRRIGLLGGSFNPAHKGHYRVSTLALRWLALDEVWWLVSPQNPLKEDTDMQPLKYRLSSARTYAQHARIRVTDIEAELSSARSYDVIRYLCQAYPRCRFVWMIGADNFVQIPKWYRWRDIFSTVPIAVFGRPPFTYASLTGQAANAYSAYRIPQHMTHVIAVQKPPAWIFLWMSRDSTSATAIRGQTAEVES